MTIPLEHSTPTGYDPRVDESSKTNSKLDDGITLETALLYMLTVPPASTMLIDTTLLLPL